MHVELAKRFSFLLSLIIYTSALSAASTILGMSNAVRCYEESLFPFSNRGISYCNDAIRHDDLTLRDLAATYSNRGIIHLKNGRFQKAMDDHDQAVRLNPDIPQVHINRGNALFYAHEYEEALVEFDMAIATHAGLVGTSLFNKALTLLKMRRLKDAVVTLEKALESDPESKRIKNVLEEIVSLSTQG